MSSNTGQILSEIVNLLWSGTWVINFISNIFNFDLSSLEE